MSLDDYLKSDVREAINQRFQRSTGGETSNKDTQILGGTSKSQMGRTQTNTPINSTSNQTTSNAWDGFEFNTYGDNWWLPRQSTAEGTNWWLDATGKDFDLHKGAQDTSYENRQYKGGLFRQLARDQGVNRIAKAKEQFTQWYKRKNPLQYTGNRYAEGNSYGDQLEAYNNSLNDAFEGWLKQTTGKNSWDQFKNGGKLIPKNK